MTQTTDSGWSARSIAASIERSVQDGRVKPAELLPPVRELATQLKVSPATVAAAYRLLRARGLTAAQGRRGTRIIPRPPMRAGLAAASPLPDGVADLSTGNPDPRLLPSLQSALRDLDPGPSLYDAPSMLPALARFAAGEFEADGVPATSMTCVGGALDGIERVLREHLRAGDHIAVEDPCFPALHDLLVAAGFVVVPFRIDDEGPDAESFAAALKRTCRAVVVTTRGQNPIGSALTEARAVVLREALRRHPDLLIIENDPCGPVAGAPLVTLVDAARHRWAHVKSLGKSLGPDLRVACIAGDAATITRVDGRYALGPRRVSHLLQRLALVLWSDPSSGRTLARAADAYAQRRRALLDALSARGIRAHGASGLNVWVPLRREGHAVQELRASGWVVAAGEPFRIDASPGMRITVATLDTADVEPLAEAIARVIAPARGPAA